MHGLLVQVLRANAWILVLIPQCQLIQAAFQPVVMTHQFASLSLFVEPSQTVACASREGPVLGQKDRATSPVWTMTFQQMQAALKERLSHHRKLAALWIAVVSLDAASVSSKMSVLGVLANASMIVWMHLQMQLATQVLTLERASVMAKSLT